MNYFKYCEVFSAHFCSVIMVSAAVRFYKLLGPCMFICLGQTEYLNLSLLPFFKHCTVLQSLVMNLFINASVCVDMWKCFLISLACYTITSVAFLSLPIYIIVSNSHNNVSSYIQAYKMAGDLLLLFWPNWFCLKRSSVYFTTLFSTDKALSKYWTLSKSCVVKSYVPCNLDEGCFWAGKGGTDVVWKGLWIEL